MKITIITINYNNRNGLERTLRSVKEQNEHSFEYIVIDGGSTDGSLDLILDNSDIIDKWVSERDNGIYHAMNKGVSLAEGEYCIFLNSGDTLHSSRVMQITQNINWDSDIVFGQVINVYPGGKKKLYKPSENITLLMIIETGIHHAGSFIRTELMRRHPYDEKYKICSDRKFFVETLVIENCSYSTLPFPVCDFEIGGISTTQVAEAVREHRHIMEEMFPPRLVADYRKTNFRIQKMTEQLVKCRYKIVGMVCLIDKFIIKTITVILGKRTFQKSR